MKKNHYFQQGDVLLFPEPIPTGVKPLKTNVLQHGEHTGHAHRVMFKHESFRAAGGYGVFEDPETKTKFLKLDESTPLSHEEHKTIELPAGEYRIGIVQEYDHFAEEARQVQD